MHRLTSSLLCAAVAVSSCGARYRSHTDHHLPGEILPADTVPLHATWLYKRWWGVAERCSGQQFPMHRVTWYSVKGPYARYGFLDPVDSSSVWGLAYAQRNAIVLALGVVADSSVVIHEALHLIASRGYHDPALYRGRCKHVVLCNEDCVADSLPPKR